MDARTEDMAKRNRFELYYVKKTAEILGVSRMTVYKLIGNNELHAKKVGRAYIIQGKDIDRFLEGNNKGE